MKRALAGIAVAVAAATATAAHAGDLCARGAVHDGAPIDLDLDGADVRAALQLVADAAHASLVIGDGVAGKVALHLRRVPWDAAACAIAGVARLALDYDGRILTAAKRGR